MQPTNFGSHVPQRRHPIHPYHPQMYSPVVATLPPVAPQYSSLRSSAQTHSRTHPSQSYYMTSYGHPTQSVERLQDDHSSFSSTPDNMYQDMASHEQPQDYLESQYAYTSSTAHHYRPQVPRSLAWPHEKPQLYHDYSVPSQFRPQQPEESRYGESAGYNGYFDDAPKESPYVPAELSPFYSGQHSAMSPEPALTAYTTQENALRSVVYHTSGSPRLSAESMVATQSGSTPPNYALNSSALQYPLTPENGVPPRFVRMQDVSPSPTISPDQVYSNLPPPSPVNEYPTSQMTYVPSEASSTSADYDERLLEEMLSEGTSARRSPATNRSPRKRQRTSSDSDSVSGVSLESGESEREEEGDDMEDEEYHPEGETPRAVKTRRVSLRRGAKLEEGSQSSQEEDRPRIIAPVPVPNLTKKSRGRRVPTSAVVVAENGVDKNVRSYRCKVPGCNKFFQRGEHLKRHVRSIHTNEKPHKCPFKKCGKDFSRHDNLRQHMRVHRNETLDSEDTST